MSSLTVSSVTSPKRGGDQEDLKFKETKDRLNRKARKCLSLDKDGQEILKDFEASLKNNFITSSFDDVVHLNQRGHRKQLMVIIILALYGVLVYGIHSVLFYFKDVDDSPSNFLS